MENLSLSVPDLIKTVKNHVGPEKHDCLDEMLERYESKQLGKQQLQFELRVVAGREALRQALLAMNPQIDELRAKREMMKQSRTALTETTTEHPSTTDEPDDPQDPVDQDLVNEALGQLHEDVGAADDDSLDPGASPETSKPTGPTIAISSKPDASPTLVTSANEVIPSLQKDSGDASVVCGEVCGKRKVRSEVGELVEQQDKWARKRGAIVASTRTDEGFKLATGMQRSCLVDAGYNAMRTLKPEVEVSLPALRRKAIPELGNEREASWGSLAKALAVLGYPFEIIEVTARFKAKGGPMLNLLKAKAGVFLVGLCVTVGEKKNHHCVMVSTVPEAHAPCGKMVDNHGKMKPVYLEESDTAHKPAAKHAFSKLMAQNPALFGADFTVTPTDIYELVCISL